MKHIDIVANNQDEALKKAIEELGISHKYVEGVEEIKPAKKIMAFTIRPATYRIYYRENGHIPISPSQMAKTFLQKMLSIMGINARVQRIKIDNNRYMIRISTKENPSLLIGKEGTTLEAIQTIVNTLLSRKYDELNEKVIIDINGYLSKREKQLKSYAVQIANQVLKTKQEVIIPPLNPYERRIIHTTIQEIEGVTTESIGEGPKKPIKVFLESNVTNKQ